MKRIIRSAKTGKFYRNGKWVTDAARAQNFPGLVLAIETAIRRRLENVEVILDYGGKFEVRMPVGTDPVAEPRSTGASVPAE